MTFNDVLHLLVKKTILFRQSKQSNAAGQRAALVGRDRIRRTIATCLFHILQAAIQSQRLFDPKPQRFSHCIAFK